MPRVGFEPTIPVFERAKTVHALDRAAVVIGNAPYRDVETDKNPTSSSTEKEMQQWVQKEYSTRLIVC
jgi:hypothetical protein